MTPTSPLVPRPPFIQAETVTVNPRLSDILSYGTRLGAPSLIGS